VRPASDPLQQEYAVETPESVSFGQEIAGIGSRFIATTIDLLLLGGALLGLNLLLWLSLGITIGRRDTSWLRGLALAGYLIVNFLLLWGYFPSFELLWQGQTPGKRLAGIRVVRQDGGPIGFIEVVVRNLVRIIDFLPGLYGLGLVTMFLNRQARRLGDLAAGTLVVKERRDIALATLTPVAVTVISAAQAERLAALRQQAPNLRVLTAADYELIGETLARAASVEPAIVRRLATALAVKLGLPAPTALTERQWLEDISLLYRQWGVERARPGGGG
jgi:uncharacterized RDD family membrane protein YckC